MLYRCCSSGAHSTSRATPHSSATTGSRQHTRCGSPRRAARSSVGSLQWPVGTSRSPSRRSPSKHATSTQQAHAKHERTIEQTYYVKQAPSGAMSGVLARICVSISDTRVLVRPSVSFFYLKPSKCGGYNMISSFPSRGLSPRSYSTLFINGGLPGTGASHPARQAAAATFAQRQHRTDHLITSSAPRQHAGS